MKIINKLEKQAAQLEKEADRKLQGARAALDSIKELQDEKDRLIKEAQQLNNSAGKHYKAAQMLKG